MATYLNIPKNQRRTINPKYGISKTKDGYYKFNSPKMIFNFKLDLSPHGLYRLPKSDKIYLDDIYNIPEKERGGYYLPEITVTRKKK